MACSQLPPLPIIANCSADVCPSAKSQLPNLGRLPGAAGLRRLPAERLVGGNLHIYAIVLHEAWKDERRFAGWMTWALIVRVQG